ncbi:MAG TPA: hypothetical protein VHW95_15075 [Steroidobacteraceae bacterium]|jgi:uncharacterized repeat protein (TIGR01451 family)|nr:hypothetical protein [Steroidobacteraceae bacterium]
MYGRRSHVASGLLIGAGMIAAATAQNSADPIAVRAVAEVEQPVHAHGREANKLAAADRVVSGDEVIYTLEVRNTAAASVPAPTVAYPVPEHMIYTADSAVGPATLVTYSVDGGRSFDLPENLKVAQADGELRQATAADYTHIRWQLKNALKSNSVAFVRFRARVK